MVGGTQARQLCHSVSYCLVWLGNSLGSENLKLKKIKLKSKFGQAAQFPHLKCNSAIFFLDSFCTKSNSASTSTHFSSVLDSLAPGRSLHEEI